MEEKILIDKDTLKAIAVDSRLNILKLLTVKQYTLSEIAETLELGNSTVKEHLDILCNADLIKKEETDRKWKYYSLTFKGRRLVNPHEVKVLFAFAFSLVAAVGAAVAFVNKMFFAATNDAMMAQAVPMMKSAVDEQALMSSSIAEAAPVSALSAFPTYYFIALLLLIGLTALLLGMYLKKPQVIVLNKETKKNKS